MGKPALGIVLILVATRWAWAQNAPPSDQYVPRAEFDRLKAAFDALQNKVNRMEKQAPEEHGPTLEDYQEMAKQVQRATDAAEASRHGTTEFLVTGDAGVGFTSLRGKNGSSSFNAGFSPLFLWKQGDRLLFEGGLDIGISNELEGSDTDGDATQTSVDLSLASLSYIVNDYLIAGGGLFAVPFGIYHPHLDPRWINKLVDDPLVFGDKALGPGTELGAFATGAAPLGPTKINYAAYITNGPRLITDDSSAAGMLSFDNFDDANFDNKAFGGRIGFLPIPELEVGYSIQYALVSPPASAAFAPQSVHALLHAVDFNFVRQYEKIDGQITLRAEWIWSDVTRATYGPFSDGSPAVNFSNQRNGGYVMVAYRPTKVGNKFLKNLELIFRYDRVEASSKAPGGGHEQRFAPGIDYWLSPSAVLKFEYEFDDNDSGPSQDAAFFQFAIGF